MGCETWPDQMLYKTCLHCGEPTTRTRGVKPLLTEEALSVLLHAEFEKFYAKRCADRGIPVEDRR